jgi:hypothetical protein
VDLNGDGNIDLLIANSNVFSFIFYGNSDGTFNRAIVLKDKSDADINLGSIIRAYDWDNDGDLDLFISEKKGGGGVKLRINEGTKTNPVFGTKNIDVVSTHYANAIVDWDGDGLWDIVGGSTNGGVYFYKNTGKLGHPSFGEAKCLIKASEILKKIGGGKAGYSQVNVVDYNNDGKLDLIIASNNERKKTFSPELKQKVEKIEASMNKYKSLIDKALKNNDDNAFDLMDKRDEIENQLEKYYRSHYGLSAHIFVSLRK